eukprot:CAMPEP_0197525914 /NCGR_PEP_ID=MMETSP1318-20131121/15079_1 /TAXON_ID=552666 /ORGANISM="Partenskyella glossopodia, Strain RCC365" /LENGTH=275 /DNA_ID=CAMNT_0043079745 /DNA_START=32 /DNA_END=859 /DNA_ORIENTATION=+
MTRHTVGKAVAVIVTMVSLSILAAERSSRRLGSAYQPAVRIRKRSLSSKLPSYSPGSLTGSRSEHLTLQMVPRSEWLPQRIHQQQLTSLYLRPRPILFLCLARETKFTNEVFADSGDGKDDYKLSDQELQWRDRYRALITQCGQHLCALAYVGFAKCGKGALLINLDGEVSVEDLGERFPGAVVPSEQIMRGLNGIPTVYVPFSDQDTAEGDTVKAIKSVEPEIFQMIDSKIDQYDPEKAFVIVLQAAGLTGVDIVQPSMPPKAVASQLRDSFKS